ncbi:uncharacterized protein LOC116132938 [Pistacia vera]|uniref:uncharacterized protein LOC116132938 n=1 Tax=Pistacia vera TaxID=55513 RepID=UPI00126356E5|nr:uncharacterized protein LOC116132938 [Pistacia vera]
MTTQRSSLYTNEEDMHLCHIYLDISQDSILAIGKLRGYVCQIENMNPSGASEQDIMIQAKMLLAQDKSYEKGFKFDHVWPILKDIEKFTDNVNATEVFQRQIDRFETQESETPTLKSPQSMPCDISSNSLNISDENIGGSSAQRPLGLAAIFNWGNSARAQNYEIQMKKLPLAEYQEDNKILFKDLNSITDPSLREFFSKSAQPA